VKALVFMQTGTYRLRGNGWDPDIYRPRRPRDVSDPRR